MDDNILMFVGVNPGYNGNELAFIDPGGIIRKAVDVLSAARRTSRDHNTYEIHPAIAIYPPEWGGIAGGEPVAAFMSSDTDEKAAIKTASFLCMKLKQKDLYIALFSSQGEAGIKTINFHSKTKLDIKEVGTVWHLAADEVFKETGIYVSACAYSSGKGTIISAQANHIYLKEIDKRTEDWMDAASKVCALASRNSARKISPQFSAARYVYFDKGLGAWR